MVCVSPSVKKAVEIVEAGVAKIGRQRKYSNQRGGNAALRFSFLGSHETKRSATPSADYKLIGINAAEIVDTAKYRFRRGPSVAHAPSRYDVAFHVNKTSRDQFEIRHPSAPPRTS